MNFRKSFMVVLMTICLGGFASAVVYEDAENANSASKWQVYDNDPAGATVVRVNDAAKQSNVIEFRGQGMGNGFILGSFSDAGAWNNRENGFIEWDMNFASDYAFYVRVKTTKGNRYLYYTSLDVSYGKGEGSEYVHFGLGAASKNGSWNTIKRDLKADVKKFESDNELISTEAFLLRGEGKIDNLQMTGGEVPIEGNDVLILYDTAGAYGHVGKTNAMFLENLLGHFNLNITSKPADAYVDNEMDSKKTVFYIGSTYDAFNTYAEGSAGKEAYKNFYKDIAIKDRTIVWINYNLFNLEQFWKDNNLNNTTFDQTYGIKFKTTSQANYNRVKYKNVELFKGLVPYATPGAAVSLCANEGNNRYACSLELNIVDIVDVNKATVFATAYSTIAGNNTPVSPYITKAGKFWFVGDTPFSYMSEEDRYLAIADVLHDMLEIYHEESHKAIIRLEDVDARTNLADLKSISDFMRQKNAPFSVATIARYEDPLGFENNGVPVTESLANSAVGAELKSLYDEGLINIVQHGTTHQYHKSLNDSVYDISNPYNGLSGDDFEFMRVIEHEDLSYSYLYPTENDSGAWAKNRIREGQTIFSEMGVKAFAWEAPHYMAGPNHYRAIAELYPVQYARVLYFPHEHSADVEKRNQFIGQFFPYVIQKDLYGYTIIPENIHNIEDIPNPGYRQLMPADTLHFAKKLKVVRDAVASFYYHPYLKDQYLGELVDGLRAEGYEFVAAPSLVKKF